MRLTYRLLLISVLLLTASVVSAEQVHIRFSHVVEPGTPKGKTSEYFKRLVEQRSDNRVRVDIYPAGTLSNDHDALDALRNNQIQLAAPSLSKLSQFEPRLQLFDLPFFFRDEDHLRRVVDGEVGQKLLASASKEGLIALGFWDNGFKQLTANRPLVRPEDVKGLQMRIEGSQLQQKQYEMLGATPRTIPFSQLYAALERGIVDGQENNLSNIYSKRLDKIQSDLTISNHAYTEYLVLTNERFWQQVPEDLQVIIKGAIKDAAAYAREMAVQLNRQALASIREAGDMRIHILSREERKQWLGKLQALYPQFEARIGTELMHKAQSAELR